MNLIVDVHVLVNGKYGALARKEYNEVSILPYVDLDFEDSAWKDAKKITSVSLNLQEDYVFITLAADELPKREMLDDHKEMLRAHGWNIE